MTPSQKTLVRTLWGVGLILLASVAVLDLTVHHHAHFERDGIVIDSWPEFFPVFGFVSALVFVLIAKTLAIGLKRKDTYYADD